MRQIVLDTETTGLDPLKGHRIIEIGCVEVRNRRKSDQSFHQFINPRREIEDGAYAVHGISNEFLAGKPEFGDIARDFIDFIRDSEVIIHNAQFDVAFIDAELRRLGREWGRMEDYCRIIDTLVMARELHPGQKNSLDALCARYQIDNSQRDLHGALLDAQILLDVYLAMTGGQVTLSLEEESGFDAEATHQHRSVDENRRPLRLVQPAGEELDAHRRRLESINTRTDGNCIWLKLEKTGD